MVAHINYLINSPKKGKQVNMLNNFEKIIDISMPVYSTMPVYNGKPEKRPGLYIQSDYNSGSIYESRIDMNLHTGTHIDLPLHMLQQGKTVETLQLDNVITSCRVLDLTDAVDKISAVDLEKMNINKNDFILLKTRNSYEDILEKEFIYLDKSAAKYLADLKVKGIGIDSLGIERSQPEHETHIMLFEAGITILEGLRLNGVPEDEYILFAAPINIVGAEAAPVRAILLK
jgi:arylformamidase